MRRAVMGRRIRIIIGATILLVLIFGGTLARYYTDWLWFGEVGYRTIFWKGLLTRIELGLIAGVLFFAIVYPNMWLARKIAPPATGRYDTNELRARIGSIARRGFGWLMFLIALGISFLVALEASTHWLNYLMFTHPSSFATVDPIFKRDIGFYVFKLGFLQYIYGWLMFTLVVAAIATALVHYTDRAIEFLAGMPTFAPHVKAHLSILLAAALFVKAWGYRLAAYNLLYSPTGVVFGAGYTDVHARLMALQVLSVVAVIAGLIALANIYRRGVTFPAAALIILIGTSLVLGGIYPAFVQQMYVKPNELRRESKYIEYNIESTRKAFNLDLIQERDFPALNDLTAQDVQNNHATINSIRLWDYRPLQSTYSQLQALWQYYQIQNVDIDRYTINDELRQVMLSARELSPETAQTGAGTWVNGHFQYTHGYGAVMSPVNRATPEGLPDFFVEDIPPTSNVGINVSQPQIYFGELTTSYVVVNSDEREFDHPAEPEPAYTKYAGKGGIPIGGFLNRAAFAWRFSDVNLVLQNPITSKSRLMFRRQIGERVQTIFPFLLYDSDPYLVISDGKLFWMWDAYTASRSYPYSTPHEIAQGHEINYIRNATKIVIDAYDGTVDYYVADVNDPIIKTYAKIFPGVFKPMSRMPAGLKVHIRYPEQLFRTQSDMLLTYHMKEPQVFYNKGDRWAVPNEIVGIEKGEAPVEPYYVVMKLPGEAKEGFILMRPFTPHSKQNMVAWMGAKCDSDDYGKMILYEFPKDKLIYGPAQIESRINQDPVISPQLSLWDQGGSRVNRGNLLVIPIEKAILYVKPLYLQSETTQIPELKQVIVSYGGQLAMESTLEGALSRIFGGAAAPSATAATARATAPTGVGLNPALQKLIDRAASELQQIRDQADRLEKTIGEIRQQGRGR
jgi:hypothetical protein